MERGWWFPDEATQAQLDKSTAAWRECMEPHGIADLPEEPWSTDSRMPHSLLERWDVESLADLSASSEEIEYVTHDAKYCRSSGWSENYYNVQWDTQERSVEQNRSELEPLLQRFREVVPQYYDIVVKYSGGQE